MFRPLLLGAIGAFTVVSSPARASGGVFCQGKAADGRMVTLAWGAGHVEGNGRISPYKLEAEGRAQTLGDKVATQSATGTTRSGSWFASPTRRSRRACSSC